MLATHRLSTAWARALHHSLTYQPQSPTPHRPNTPKVLDYSGLEHPRSVGLTRWSMHFNDLSICSQWLVLLCTPCTRTEVLISCRSWLWVLVLSLPWLCMRLVIRTTWLRSKRCVFFRSWKYAANARFFVDCAANIYVCLFACWMFAYFCAIEACASCCVWYVHMHAEVRAWMFAHIGKKHVCPSTLVWFAYVTRCDSRVCARVWFQVRLCAFTIFFKGTKTFMFSLHITICTCTQKFLQT